jgi:hypothetical protein
MEIKVYTTDSPDDAEKMSLDMKNTGFRVIVCDKADIATVLCGNLTNGCTASGLSTWVVIGQKP